MFAVDRRTKLLTLGAMCFALFMAMLDNTVVNVALPSIQSALRLGRLRPAVDHRRLHAWSLPASCSRGGTLGDLYGRKRFFLIGLSVFTARLAALRRSRRRCTGSDRRTRRSGPGRGRPAAGHAIDPHQHLPRPSASAPRRSASGPASRAWLWLLGPSSAARWSTRFGWQSVFFLNVPIGVVALAVALRAVRESTNPEGRRLDLPGQVLAIVALGSLTYALIEANNYGWTSTADPRPVRDGRRRAGAAFLWVEVRSSSPMLPLNFFRNPTFAAAATVRRPDQLRHVRHVLLPHALLAERAGLLALPDGPARAAGHRRSS